ncbi:hypothetical protein PV327_010399 [Microctonus hyperodae]|uniref:Mediator of DNA damage checkpoint protein 1 n=1 Tax=Microctonus hyperodae TaxID=165561 RepID=A0AA39FRT9_MICHY|nr:hypothetical protein PV327_010399 [Microctonus hyperodae]
MNNLTDEEVYQVGSLCIGEKKYPVFEGINTIGRDPNCDIFLSDITVSKNHAKIKAYPKSAFVCDLRSSNKTRLNNEILRPQRFYQVVDEAELTFGVVNARYLFLRDIDNQIIVPETPAPNAKNSLNSSLTSKKNFNYSLIDESDDDSVIPATQANTNDNHSFATPSARNLRSSYVARQRKTKKIISIHDVETQQSDNESTKDISCDSEVQCNSDADDIEDIHSIQTQKIVRAKNTQQSIHDIAKVANPYVNLKRSIHDLETQKFDKTEDVEFNIKKRKVINSFMKSKESIYELETQKFEEIQPNAIKTVSCNKIILNAIYTAETQRDLVDKDESSSIKSHKTQCEENKEVAAAKESKKVNKKNKNSKAIDTLSEASQNQTSDHIIEETDDDSETDEEGTFANIQSRVQKCDQSKKGNINSVPDCDSETDEDGEFATLSSDWSADSTNLSKKIPDKNDNTVTNRQIETRSGPESPCLNERFVGQNSIENDEIINSDNDDESAENINNSEKNHQADLLNKKADRNNPLLPTTPKLSFGECKSNKSARKSLNKTFISDDVDGDVNIPSTQFIPISESNKSIAQSPEAMTEVDGDDDDNLVSTQIIQSPKTQNVVEQLNKTSIKSNNILNVKSPQISISNDKIVAKKLFNKNQKENKHENDEITVQEDIPSTQSKNNLEIDDTVATQRIEQSSKNCSDCDNLSTQVIDQKTARIQAEIAFKKAQTDKNHEVNSESTDKNRSNNNVGTPTRRLRNSKNNEVKESKMSLRSRRNLEPSIATIEEQPTNFDNSHDNISENLENLFGKENKIDNFIVPTTLATQQLQDILEHSENIRDKNCGKVKAAHKLNVFDSPDTDSQEYFRNLHSKRKHCIIIDSDDTTDLEGDTNTSSPANNVVYEAGTSGFDKGVAVISETTIAVQQSPVKKQQKNSKEKEAELKSTIQTMTSDDEENEKDDILKDDWEKYEKRRLDSLASKKKSVQTKVEKSSVSSDDEDLNYEDLKKMAVDFIADTRTKELSIKLEKIPNPQNYRSFSNDSKKENSINLDETSEVFPDTRKRGRPRRVANSKSVLKDDKNNLENSIENVDNISQTKRSRLQSISVDSSPGSSTITAELPETPSRSKKSKANIVESPSSSNRVQPQHTVLLTGINRTEYAQKVKQCGGVITDAPDEATILVTDKIRRTNKLFCAITRHIPIVSVEWIEDSMKEKSLLDWNDYFLKDPVVEEKYKFSLKESLERASKQKLLDGFTFIITSHVTQPSVEEIKSMIQMSGGKALIRPPKVWTPNTIIITCLPDVPKVKNLLSKAPADLKIPVFSTEFILSGILKQELNFDTNCIQI